MFVKYFSVRDKISNRIIYRIFRKYIFKSQKKEGYPA